MAPVEREILIKLLDALERKDTERDGNWGYKPFHVEILELKARLEMANDLGTM